MTDKCQHRHPQLRCYLYAGPGDSHLWSEVPNGAKSPMERSPQWSEASSGANFSGERILQGSEVPTGARRRSSFQCCSATNGECLVVEQMFCGAGRQATGADPRGPGQHKHGQEPNRGHSAWQVFSLGQTLSLNLPIDRSQLQPQPQVKSCVSIMAPPRGSVLVGAYSGVPHRSNYPYRHVVLALRLHCLRLWLQLTSNIFSSSTAIYASTSAYLTLASTIFSELKSRVPFVAGYFSRQFKTNISD